MDIKFIGILDVVFFSNLVKFLDSIQAFREIADEFQHAQFGLQCSCEKRI